MSNVFAKAKHEFLKVLPPTLFFFFMLVAIATVRALLLHDTGISTPSFATVVVASLILGKAVLIADMLPFINRYPDRPLIWNAGWKMVIYATIAMLFHYAERLFDYWKDAHNIAAANHELLTHINWAHFWAIQILLFVLVGNYCVLAEIGRLLGKGVLKAMFVGPLSTVPRKNLTQYQA